MIGELPDGVRWGVSVRDAATGAVLAERDADATHAVASIGKLLLLIELARGLATGEYDADEPVRRDSTAPVADSGLWQHLRTPALTLHDAAVLVGSVSDNLATNVLLQRVGLAAIDRVRDRLGTDLRLHDLVRDERGPQHPPTLSTGSAGGLSALLGGLHAGTVLGGEVSRQVLTWLAPGADLSMVASAFGLDPLAHVDPDRGVQVWSKTGTSPGVRADVGVIARGERALAYAVLAQWDDAAADRRDDVLAAMRRIGGVLERRLAGQGGPGAPSGVAS